ncbi:unnamed protein product [Auanema sp. JU1783]|nr:unnamed protein product [Auanema sp. JU1783]
MHENTVKRLERMIFTTSPPNAASHSCAVVFDKKHAVSFAHGSHSQLKEAEIIYLYNVLNPDVKVEVTVKAISKLYDVAVFEIRTGVFPDVPRDNDTYCGAEYKQLGVDSKRELTWNSGVVVEKRRCNFYGTSQGKQGDSGSGLYDDNGRFIGISIRMEDFAFPNLSNMTIQETAYHTPDTKIVSCNMIVFVAGIVDPD